MNVHKFLNARDHTTQDELWSTSRVLELFVYNRRHSRSIDIPCNCKKKILRELIVAIGQTFMFCEEKSFRIAIT